MFYPAWTTKQFVLSLFCILTSQSFAEWFAFQRLGPYNMNRVQNMFSWTSVRTWGGEIMIGAQKPLLNRRNKWNCDGPCPSLAIQAFSVSVDWNCADAAEVPSLCWLTETSAGSPAFGYAMYIWWQKKTRSPVDKQRITSDQSIKTQNC
jgi:hypothetical protein